jgi:hypothetical protein
LARFQRPCQAWLFDDAAITDLLRLFDLGNGGAGIAHGEEELRIFFAAGRLMSPIHGYPLPVIELVTAQKNAHKRVILPVTLKLNKKVREKISLIRVICIPLVN